MMHTQHQEYREYKTESENHWIENIHDSYPLVVPIECVGVCARVYVCVYVIVPVAFTLHVSNSM